MNERRWRSMVMVPAGLSTQLICCDKLNLVVVVGEWSKQPSSAQAQNFK